MTKSKPLPGAEMQKLIKRPLVRLIRFSRPHWLRIAEPPSLQILPDLASILTKGVPATS